MFSHYITSKYRGSKHELDDNQADFFDTTIQLNKEKTFQNIIGFGGAFTEAAAYTLSQVTTNLREEVLQSYYNKSEGLNYTIGRVHINSCDFCLENYTYVNDFDVDLESFNIDRELQYVVPLIKDAEKIAGHKISLMASPWSPPAWMKSNNEMNHGGVLLPKYYQVWANYYVKFIDEFKKLGLQIDYVSVQNEPAAVQVWDSCIYSAEAERDFIKHYLGPTLQKAHPEVKIIIWDHNRDILVERGNAVLSDEDTRDYVWGTGVHWYVSEEFENLSKLHTLHPDKHLLFTEGCIEGGVHLNDWTTGERYARNMIGDFRNYCEGYIDWNITLNEMGGPNHVGNFCDAPIITDTLKQELNYNSSYYYIGHFSKYIVPGSKRILSESNHKELKHVAFLSPNNEVILIVLNETEERLKVKLQLGKQEQIVEILPRSISTLIERS